MGDFERRGREDPRPTTWILCMNVVILIGLAAVLGSVWFSLTGDDGRSIVSLAIALICVVVCVFATRAWDDV